MEILIQTSSPLAPTDRFASDGTLYIPDNANFYRGYTIADKAFTINVYQSMDGNNFDFISTFNSESVGGNYQCGYIVDRIGIFVKFEIVNGNDNMSFLRGYLAI